MEAIIMSAIFRKAVNRIQGTDTYQYVSALRDFFRGRPYYGDVWD
jgi:hypothetical protein